MRPASASMRPMPAIALAEHLPMRGIVPHRKLSFFFIFNDINDFINRNF
jgi:hypothetical protein